MSLSPVAVRALSVAWLALVWVCLWGDASIGTVVAGLAIGIVVMRGIAGRRYPGSVRVRPLRVLVLGGVFGLMLAESTIEVVRQVLRPRLDHSPAIIEVALPPAPPAVATLVANAVTLTPGTLSLDLLVAEDESAVLQIHALDAPDPETVRRETLRLHALALRAFDRPQGTSPRPIRSAS